MPPKLYSAATWAELFPSTVPTTIGGEFGAMAYDKARNQTVLVDEKSSTYTFDGINWTLRNPPSNLNSNLKQLVYDETNSQIVAVGGSGVFETWVWDGTTWTQKFPATQPPARDSFGLAYDGAIGKVVLFGGENGSDLNDTWLWTAAPARGLRRFPLTSPACEQSSHGLRHCQAASRALRRAERYRRSCVRSQRYLGLQRLGLDAAIAFHSAYRPELRRHGLG